MDDFTVEVHHGGSFAHDPLRLPTVSMEDGGLRVVSIDSDKDAMAMVDAVEGHNVIELFVEHCVDVPDAVEEHRTITAGFEVDEDFSDSEESSDDDGHSNGANERCVRKLVTYGDMESDEDLRDSLYFGQGGIEQERIKTGLSDNDEAYLSEELLSMDDDDVRPQYPVYKPPKKAKYIKFEIGMKFNSLQEFKNAVTDYAVHGGHGIRFEKNDKVRVRAVCKKGCKWVAYAVKMAGEMTCQLRTFVNEHTCSRSYLNSRATSKWLGKKLTNRISEQPDMPCSTIQEKVHKKFVVNISRSKAYRAKKIALEKIEGSHKEQYSRIRDYCTELLRTNGGSSVLLKTDIENLSDREIERPGRSLNPVFERLYVCLDACKKGFVHCRPFIGVDACHLKGPYGGQLIAAIARDPNEQFFPLAFAVVEAETKDSWTWFLLQLIEDVNASSKRTLTFISDEQKGLVPTFEEVFSGMEHRLCVRHMYNNFKKKFPGIHLKDLFWRIASATYEKQWERAMKELKEVDRQAFEWVESKPKEKWCKHKFKVHSKCDTLVNNMCESFNGVILKARQKPIIGLVEDIRLYLMRRFEACREGIKKVEGDLCPNIRKKLSREKLNSGNWESKRAGNGNFEVCCGAVQYTVNLKEKNCTCKRWDLSGVPCCHAISCIFYQREAAEDYVDQCYKISTYVACYDPIVMPINGPDMWEATGLAPVEPPRIRRPPGRPKKLRRREPDEPRPQSAKLRGHVKVKLVAIKGNRTINRAMKGQSNRRDRDSASASASAAASKQPGSTTQATSSAHLGSNAHAQSTASVHGHSTASATATAGITSASSIARANVEMSPSVPPEIYGPPPSWRPQASISRETLMGTSQSARYREAFHILGSQESVHAPLPPPPKKGP
uniref:SWIM-type domain-containing protein n=1 Tax=Fagus sylvatica TaxID=28930 RepID=A0A2N9EMB4_FAGSY